MPKLERPVDIHQSAIGGGTPVKFDPTKAAGPARQASLTPEYQKVL
jgi:hypothetical protein